MPTKAERNLLLAVATAADPTSVDAFGRLDYTPTPRQQAFHDSTAHAVLYGGALGGGKTAALLAEGLRAAVRYPGIRIGAFRRTYDELAESFLAELAKRDFAEALGARWNKGKSELTFPNGSVIRFRYAESIEDASRRQGGEYQLILFDEAGLVPGAVIEALEERQRSSRASIPVLGLRLASNPGGIGHSWLKSRFVDPTDYGRHGAVDEHGRSVAFIPARAADNPYLDANYDRQLAAISDPARRAAMRDGNWDIMAGAAFEEWDRDRLVVPAFTVPPQWYRYCGIDFGWTAPWCAIWLAVDQDGRCWLYRELYASKVGEREQARQILRAERDAGERSVLRVMDPAAWGQTGTALSPAVQYCLEGCGVEKAQNDRLAGISRFHTYLSDGPACAHHRQMGWETCPHLHVLDGTCPNFVRTIPSLPRDPRRPEDVLTTAEDHSYDSARYALMAIGFAGGSVISGGFGPGYVPEEPPYSVPLPPHHNGTTADSPFV